MSPSDNLSVFDILNIFRHRWFLSRASLLSHVVAAQKAAHGKVEWVEFDGPFHSHLVKCALALVPRPPLKVKKVMFCFILEVLNDEVPKNFFDLPSGQSKGKRHRLAGAQRRGIEAAQRPAVPKGGKKCVGGEEQVPDLSVAPASDPVPPPSLPVASSPPPPPPIDSSSLSPLDNLILIAPPHSFLSPMGDNPLEEGVEILRTQEQRWELIKKTRRNVRKQFWTLKYWEVLTGNYWESAPAAPAEEMEVDFALGGIDLFDHSPSPPPSPSHHINASGMSPGGTYRHWLRRD